MLLNVKLLDIKLSSQNYYCESRLKIVTFEDKWNWSAE